MNKKKKITFISLTLAMNILVSCNHKADYQQFLIKVDSIQVSNTLTASEPFDINFFGTIAGDGCHSFSNFDIQQSDNNILIEAWGKVDRKGTACPTVMVYLTGHKATCTVQVPGNYILKIKQPDNTFLEKQIAIK